MRLDRFPLEIRELITGHGESSFKELESRHRRFGNPGRPVYEFHVLGPHPNGVSVKTARMLLSGWNSHSKFQQLRPGRTAALARATSRRRIANQCEVRNFKLKLFLAKGSDLRG
jgi:hypothetical protein